VRALEALRRMGSPLTLSWDAWRFRVIIHEFEATVTNANWMPYRIELCVVPDLLATVVDWLTTAVAPTLAGAALNSAALNAGIEASGAALLSTSLGTVVAASGQLANYVTQRAYGGVV